MKVLKLILLLASFNLMADSLSVGVGKSWKSDYYGKQTNIDAFSVTYKVDDWKFSAQHFKEYRRSPWADTNPEWGSIKIPKHMVLSATREIYSLDVGGFDLFFDFGLSYVDRLSHVNSSHILFHENLGFKYGEFVAYFSHTSNAGLKSPNTGEDLFFVGYQYEIPLK